MGVKVRKRLRISIRGTGGGVLVVFSAEMFKVEKNISIKGSTRVAPSYNIKSRFELSD